MPRESPFRIILSKEERTLLEAQVRQYTSPYCDVIRAKIVLLAAEGLSNDVIAARLDTPRQIVSKWRKRCNVVRANRHFDPRFQRIADYLFLACRLDRLVHHFTKLDR